jgi:hypothetical protein
MEKSEGIKALAEALARAQAEMPPVPFNAVNPFLKNRFADLGSVISTVQPVLAKHGLSVSQLPFGDGGIVGITTILLHISGEWLETSISLPLEAEKGKSAAQAAGSIITYLRRYSLAAIIGAYSEEDADGNEPPKPARKQAPPTPTTSPQESRPSIRPLDADALKAMMARKVAAYKGKSANPSEEQLDYCRSSMGKLGLSDADRHTVTLWLFGKDSTTNLTAAECSAIIDWVGAKPPDYEPSQDARIEARACIRAYLIQQGQQELPDQGDMQAWCLGSPEDPD